MAFSFFPALPKQLKAAWHALTMRADMLSDLRHPSAWLVSWALGGRTHAGIDVSPASAMTLPAYYAALRAISEDIGKLPLITYERLDPRGKRRAIEHPLYALLHDSPNEWMSACTWRESLTHYALSWGNGYAEIIRDRGEVVALGRPIHPSRVALRFDENGHLLYEIHTGELHVRGPLPLDQPTTLVLPQRDVLHLRGLGDGLLGYSVAQMAAESLGLSLAAQQFGAKFFGNGTHTGGIFTHPQTLSDTAQQHLRESLDRYRVGGDDALKVLLLEEGMTYERATIPPEDAQFLQTREFQVVEIARWFRIPPHKIAELTHATFSNIEHQGLEYVVDTLQPWLVRWEQELKRKLFADDPDYFAEHQVLGLLRGDQQARSNYYRTLFYIGAISPNDIRELENQNPIVDGDGDLDPAGDMYFCQNNLATLATIAKQTTLPPSSSGFPPRPAPASTPFEDEEENEEEGEEEDEEDQAAHLRTPHRNGVTSIPWEED